MHIWHAFQADNEKVSGLCRHTVRIGGGFSWEWSKGNDFWNLEQQFVDREIVARVRHIGPRVCATRVGLAPKTFARGADPKSEALAIPQNVMEFVPEIPVELDVALFTKCLRSAPSGSASGLGGCTNEMLQVCLDDCELFQLLFPESVKKGLCLPP